MSPTEQNPGAAPVTEEAVLQALRAVRDPDAQQDIVTLGLVKGLVIQNGQVSFTLEFTTQPALAKAEIHSQARKVVSRLAGVSEVKAAMGSTAPAAGRSAQAGADAPRQDLIPEVKHTIAVSSGKGGVGKSTVAVNLALALHQAGGTVGLVDVDVYGPDIPLMIGARGKPGMFEYRIIPVESYGVKVISIGFFVAPGEAIIWRGPMIHSAVQQFLKDVMWGELDYLIFDMPPGTGDAQLSLSQVIPLSGVVMVTTPQDVALLDVRKALAMFRKLNVPILGVVENMSDFACPHCGERTPIFGEGGGKKIAEEVGVPLLAQIPLDPETRKGGDEGRPILLRKPESPQAAAFRELAAAVAERVSMLSVLKLPTIA
ncbi:MAG: Mrp/NBP35 family ATP-binding protein [Candidatus Rokubacteria bacterium]|nr:Mrp/NBP35 family ATP-binding protein [Candidatus Rokubacteria bacterium]